MNNSALSFSFTTIYLKEIIKCSSLLFYTYLITWNIDTEKRRNILKWAQSYQHKRSFPIFFNGGENDKNDDANRSFFDSSGLDGSSSGSSSLFIWEGSIIIIIL